MSKGHVKEREVSIKNLIFIEGVSGVGKTITAQKLRGMGFSADCYLEFNFTNPIDFYCTAYFTQDNYAALLAEYPEFSNDIKRNTIKADKVSLVRYYNGNIPLFAEPLLNVFRNHEFCWNPINHVPFSEYTHVYISVWEQFAHSKKNQIDYLIFDGSLFHHPINDMIRNFNVSCDQAISHINSLIEIVLSLNPRIVYLSSENVAERLHDARLSRKETPPSAEQIQFWEERKRIDFGVMKQLAIPFDIYNIFDGNWDSITNKITKHILDADKQI